jgi:putative Ca2+/H+ antiporter (TMEM165/GDT1 family)
LVVAAGIGVLVGGQLERFVSPTTLKLLAGLGFIGIGIWTLFSK